MNVDMEKRRRRRGGGGMGLLAVGALALFAFLGMRRPTGEPGEPGEPGDGYVPPTGPGGVPYPEGTVSFSIGKMGQFTVLGQVGDGRPIPITNGSLFKGTWPVTHTGKGGTFHGAIVLGLDPGGWTNPLPNLADLQEGAWNYFSVTVPDHPEPTVVQVPFGLFVFAEKSHVTEGRSIRDGQEIDVHFVLSKTTLVGAGYDRFKFHDASFGKDWDRSVFVYVAVGPPELAATSFSVHSEGSKFNVV